MSKFKPGDKVVVTNIDGWESNGLIAGELFEIQGIGDTGIVVSYDESDSWPVQVIHEYGGEYYYSESELEKVE